MVLNHKFQYGLVIARARLVKIKPTDCHIFRACFCNREKPAIIRSWHAIVELVRNIVLGHRSWQGTQASVEGLA